MNLLGGGPSVPVNRVSPPLAQELEARGGVGNVHPFVSCLSAHTLYLSCLVSSPFSLDRDLESGGVACWLKN